MNSIPVYVQGKALGALKSKPAYWIKDKILYLITNVLWIYTLVGVLLKSIILIGFITDESHSTIDIALGFYNISSLSVYCSFILVLLSFSFLLKGRGQLWYLIFSDLFISVLMVIDLWYYRGFGTFISLHQLKEVANLDNTSDSIFSMGRWVDIVLIFDVLLLIAMSLIIKKPYKNMKRSVVLFIIFLVLPVSYIGYTHYEVDVMNRGAFNSFFEIKWAPVQTISNLSPIGFHVYDTYNFWQDSRQLKLKPEEKKEIKDWFEAKIEDIPDNKYKALFKGKNLMLIQVESMEGFVIRRKIGDQEITPNLNKLLQNSLYFPDFYEQVYNGSSADADFLANTSVYPVRRGSTFFRYPDHIYYSLPKMLQKQGYLTTAMHPDKGAFWNWMKGLKGVGFEKCVDAASFNQDESIGLGMSDFSFFQQVEPRVKEMKQPFYTFMVTLTSHIPFNLPTLCRGLVLDKELDKSKLGGYFQSVNYTDRAIGQFISKLRKDGLLDNTVIVIYGDHCGIHKYYADELKDIKPSQDWWMDNHKRIPLIIYQNGLQGEELGIKGGQVDIMPTVAYLMGIDDKEYERTAMGRNLLKTQKDFAVLANQTYVGESVDQNEKDQAIKGIGLADKIIRSNYYRESED